jgi:hypothetical protein
MTPLTSIVSVHVPRRLIDEGHLFLRSAGAAGCEGMLLWLGEVAGSTFIVTRLLIPQQKGIKTKDGVCVVVGPEEMHRINLLLYKTGLRLIAQIHSHPGAAYHSDTDDGYAIATTTGSFSLVVPDFARRPFSIGDCATYRLHADGRWVEWPQLQARSAILITEA